MVTISWIKAYKKEFKVLLKNRAQEIRKNFNPRDWYHCESSNNPTDLLTCKGTIENFKDNFLWWEGSNFLKDSKKEEQEEPIENSISKEHLLSEIKSLVVHKTRENIVDIINFNLVNKLYRVTAWIKRFVNNVRNKKENRELLLTSTELRNSELYWIKENQKSIENKHIELLWIQLNVMRDENDLLICTGRLENALLPYESKIPYLINRHHKLAELVVTNTHIKLKHISIKQTLTEVHRRFWIRSGRSFLRNILSKCTLCRRFEGPRYSYPTTPPLAKL